MGIPLKWSVFLFSGFLFANLAPAAHLHAQNTAGYCIRGRVFDAQTGQPVPHANAFLAHSMLGDAGDEQGIFQINNIPAGQHELIVSVLGYELYKKTLRLPAATPVILTVALTPRIIPFPEIEISADTREWRKNLRRFSEQLIGTSRNARMTEIENAYCLDFRVNDDTLIATANEPLRIINRGLGYKIYYVLESFRASRTTARFSGLPRFDTLAANSSQQLRTWKERRKQAYQGSLRHFLTVLCANFDSVTTVLKRDPTLAARLQRGEASSINLLSREGFVVYRLERPVGSPQTIRRQIDPYSLIRAGTHPEDRVLTFRGSLQVVYNRGAEQPEYLAYLRLGRWTRTYQTSLIEALQDSVTIDVRGRYFDTFALHTKGYWGWQRLAEMLPFEYSPAGPAN